MRVAKDPKTGQYPRIRMGSKQRVAMKKMMEKHMSPTQKRRSKLTGKAKEQQYKIDKNKQDYDVKMGRAKNYNRLVSVTTDKKERLTDAELIKRREAKVAAQKKK